MDEIESIKEMKSKTKVWWWYRCCWA